MSTREAFRAFFKFQLENGEVAQFLSDEEINKFLNGIEDDPMFYDKLDEFLVEYVEDFGENYGV